MTRPLTPRPGKPWHPRPWSPLLTVAVLAAGVAASAGAGLHTAIRDSAPVAAVSHSVQMANFAFVPQVLAVTSGDSVTWTNQDEAPHTVTTTSGPRSISSPMLSKGQSFTYTFVAPGTYSYYCAVHPDMRAEIVVSPAAAATPSSSAKPSTAAPPQPVRSTTGGAVHIAPPTTAQPRQEMTAPSGSTAASSASSSAAVLPASGTSVTSVTSAAPAAAAPSPEGGRPLDPALVLAGLTAGTTVFCLLLVASRRSEES